MNVLPLILYFAILIGVLIVEIIASRKARKREEDRREKFLIEVTNISNTLQEINKALWYEK